MDLPAALSAASVAVKITKDLRDVERGFEASEYKLKIADLQSALADVKVALVDAQEENRSLERKLEEIRSGENCPICQLGRMKITDSEPHAEFAFAGVQMRTISCDNIDCDNHEKRPFDPSKDD